MHLSNIKSLFHTAVSKRLLNFADKKWNLYFTCIISLHTYYRDVFVRKRDSFIYWYVVTQVKTSRTLSSVVLYKPV